MLITPAFTVFLWLYMAMRTQTSGHRGKRKEMHDEIKEAANPEGKSGKKSRFDNIETLKLNAFSEASRGKDLVLPNNPYRRARRCMVITHVGDTVVVYDAFRFQQNFFSQMPHFSMQDCNHCKVLIGPEQIKVADPLADTIQTQHITASQVVESLQKWNIILDATQEGQVKKRAEDIGSLNALHMRLQSNPHVALVLGENAGKPMTPNMTGLYNDVQKECTVTVLQQYTEADEKVVNPVWLARMTRVFREGIYPDYTPSHIVRNNDGNNIPLLEAYLDSPTLYPLPVLHRNRLALDTTLHSFE